MSEVTTKQYETIENWLAENLGCYCMIISPKCVLVQTIIGPIRLTAVELANMVKYMIEPL
jgi:hypothetical protein